MSRIGLFAWIALTALGVANARGGDTEESTTRTNSTQVTSSKSQLDTRQEKELAEAWGLKDEEWTRYRALMRGPLGIYSPNLDPLTALGIQARTEAERKRYAEMQVRMEGVRVNKLLSYQRAYDDAWRRLHPTLHRVRLNRSGLQQPGTRASATSTHNAVFVKADCRACDERVRTLQAAGRAFDLYMIGTRGEDAAIRAWASRVGIDPKKVRERTITLNHDAGRWLSIGDGGALPAVLREVNGRWQRE